MFLKVIFTIIALALAAFVALQSKTYVDIRVLSAEISVSLAVVVWCFLSLGIGIGMIWRSVPRSSQVKMQNQVPIITDLKVSK